MPTPRQQRPPSRKSAPASCEAAEFFVFRTPLLPFEELESFSAGLGGPEALATPDVLEAALAADRAALRERLRAATLRPEVREALFVASPSLDESLEHWLKNPESERGQKVERSLVRYFARMAGRSTPFGLFSGCSLGRIGATTRLAVAERRRYLRHTRLDMDYLFALTEGLGKDPELRRGLTYRPSTSLYRAAGRLRYAEARLDGKVRTYHLVAVEPTPYLEDTLARCQRGALPGELGAALVNPDEGISPEEAASFIDELIDSQLIVPELTPAVTGDEPIHDVVAQLLAHPGGAQLAARLDGVRRALAALDEGGVGNAPERYHAIARKLEGLPAEVELPRLFQVDMAKPAPEAVLGGEPLAEILTGVELLRRISPAPGESAISRFRDAFMSRYEGRTVPLAEALDEESGIGFDRSNAPTAEASPLLAGLLFPPGEREAARFSDRHGLFLRKVQEAQASGSLEIRLDDEDLKQLENPRPAPLPTSFAVFATLLADSAAALAEGKFRVYLQGGSGPSGANLLGRFCHVDRELDGAVRRYLRAEEQRDPDALFAEIVHLPEGRIGNVLLRPVLREYEIPFLGRSGAPPERQIPITDLYVSVEGGQVVLRSASLGRRIIPRLTTAHNFNLRGLGIYRFLCSLQFQEVGGIGWNWGPLADATFLPRVAVGRLVLARARWRLGEDDLKPLGSLRGAALFAAVAELRRRLGMPRWVVVTDGDNQLPVDFDNVLLVETFAHLVKGRRDAVLEELIAGVDGRCVEGPEGSFVHELVVPLWRAQPKVDATQRPAETEAAGPAETARPAAAARRVTLAPIVRSFPPGSEWLYAKLYCGTATTDEVLREMVTPLVDEALGSGAADGWFFIRYGDPDWHLRLRFHGAPERLLGEVLPALHAACAPLLAGGLVYRLVLDTYEREVERYGGPAGMTLSERLFQADSEAALGIVGTLAGDVGSDARWRLALRGMDRLCDDFGLSLERRHALLQRIRASFGAEFRVEVNFEKQLGDKYRKERIALEELLDPAQEEASWLGPGLALLGRRSAQSAPIVAALREAERAGQLTLGIDDLLPSYLHMMANRLLRSAARAQELVIYDFLERLYQSRLVRQRQRGAATSG